MAAKAQRKTKKKTKEDLVQIALDLSVERGWQMVTLRDIAETAKISLADLHDMFEDKVDILVAFGRMIDRKVLENVSDPDPEISVRDQLFDVMMDRYEVLNEYREGLVSVLDSFVLDPKQAVISFPHLCRSMTWMLEAAGVETDGITGAIKVTGLTGVYLNVLRTWKEDDSPDLSKTMAALDKNLNRSEQVINMFSL